MLKKMRSYTSDLRNTKAREYHRSYGKIGEKEYAYITDSYKSSLIMSFYDILHLCLYKRHLIRLVFIKEPIKAIIHTYKYRKFLKNRS